MGVWNDLKILYHLALSPIRGESHADRLESFYGGQAEQYDDFRKRLLHGREQLCQSLPLAPGGVWVDLGGGTGANVAFAGDAVRDLQQVYVVDLSPSLLRVARQRFESLGLDNARAIEADATRWMPPEGYADVVTFSYSLTMIPDWFRAIDHARALLRPGGTIGVVDFFVSRKYPEPGRVRHGYATRTFWPWWFSNDNVFLSPDHVPYLQAHFETQALEECRARVPYIPLMQVPYYRYVGVKPAPQNSAS